MYLCMGTLCHCIELLGTQLGNSTGHRTATMAAPLLLTSGPVWYEAPIHGCGTNPVFVVAYILATSKVRPRWLLMCDSVH